MEKKLLNEINNIRSMMGLKLIKEAATASIIDDMGKLFLQILGGKQATETVIIKGFTNPKTYEEIFEKLMSNFDNLLETEKKLLLSFLNTKNGKKFLEAYESSLKAYKNSPRFDKATYIEYNKSLLNMKQGIDDLIRQTPSKTGTGSVSNAGRLSTTENKLQEMLAKKANFDAFWLVFNQELKNAGAGWLNRQWVKIQLQNVYSQNPKNLKEVSDGLLRVLNDKLDKKLTKKSLKGPLSLRIANWTSAAIKLSIFIPVIIFLLSIIGLITGQIKLNDILVWIKSRLSPQETAKEATEIVKEVAVGVYEGVTSSETEDTKPSNDAPPPSRETPPREEPRTPDNTSAQGGDLDRL